MKTIKFCMFVILCIMLSACESEMKMEPAESTAPTEITEVTVPDAQVRMSEVKVEPSYVLEQIDDETEAKIDLYLRRIEAGQVIWEKSWQDIYLTELSPYSQLLHKDGRLYIEVFGELYVMDDETGEEIFKPVRVGVGEKAFVDDEGNSYHIGYYGPFATKVSPDGAILWQKDFSESYYWPWQFYLEGQYMYVECEAMDNMWVNTLQLNKETGSLMKAYWTEADQVIFESLSASSELVDYPLNNLIDNNPATGWVAAGDKSGVGQSIIFKHFEARSISKIVLLNGYHKSQALYEANNRVASLEIKFSDGSSIPYTCVDDMVAIEILLDEPVQTSSVELRIQSIVSGTKYDDTVISGVYFYE